MTCSWFRYRRRRVNKRGKNADADIFVSAGTVDNEVLEDARDVGADTERRRALSPIVTAVVASSTSLAVPDVSLPSS